MAIDLYHRVLLKLYEECGGRSGKTVDFVKLTKDLGLFGNYADIFERLNVEGWIAETSKKDYVEITTWGITEAKKYQSGDGANNEARQQIARSSRRSAALANELAQLLNEYAPNQESDFGKITEKFKELQNEFAQIKR